MNPALKPGIRISARETDVNRACGVRPGAMGRIVFTDSSRVSIYLERGMPGAGWIEATCEPETLALNFDVYEHDVAPGYVGRGHFQKQYPDDWRR
jgi:hypothetical protein